MSLVEGSLVTVPEAAKLLCLQPSTIRKWLHERRIARVKIGRRTVVRRAELENLVEQGMQRASAVDHRSPSALEDGSTR